MGHKGLDRQGIQRGGGKLARQLGGGSGADPPGDVPSSLEALKSDGI